METKICSKCHIEKPIDDFAFRNKSKNTRRAECKECIAARQRTRYHDNKQVLDEWKQQCQCEKCGETRFYVLDFHHVDPTNKVNTVARLTCHSNRSAAVAERKKCICLCANCHREFHYLERENGITLEEYLQ